MAPKTIIMIGSTKTAIVISRLDPIPPKALPGSSPPSTKNIDPKIKTPPTIKKSLMLASFPPKNKSGKIAASATAVAKTTYGTT